MQGGQLGASKRPHELEERAASRSPWQSVPRHRRILFAVLLTAFTWGLGAGTLLLLGASGYGFWIPFLIVAMAMGFLFAALGSGDRGRVLSVLRLFRVLAVTAFVVAAAVAVAGIIVSFASDS
jgi:hypothetical protein